MRKWTSREDERDGVRYYKRSVWMEDLVSITDLLDYCVVEGLDPGVVRLNKPTLQYESPETEEERERREKFQREHAERTEKWERETYERLKEKFDGPSA